MIIMTLIMWLKTSFLQPAADMVFPHFHARKLQSQEEQDQAPRPGRIRQKCAANSGFNVGISALLPNLATESTTLWKGAITLLRSSRLAPGV